MLKVLDVFPIGSMLSVTLEGECKGLSNQCKLIDNNGNVIIVISVAMTRHENPCDIKKSTTVLVEKCSIEKGSVLKRLA